MAGHDAIGHNGGTMTFFSDLRFFPAQGVGIFVSRNGIGDIRAATDIPNPAVEIAKHFLPAAPDATGPEAELPEAADAHAGASPGEAGVAGIYHPSRRAESSILRLNDLASQRVVRIDGAGNASLSSAIWPFAAGLTFKRVDRNVYEGLGMRLALVNDGGSESYIAVPGASLRRVPWTLDMRWIAPALVASAMVALLTLLIWPFAALWRWWCGKRWGGDSADRRRFLAVRLVLLVDMAVVVATAALLGIEAADPTVLSDALDPLLLALYALAWLGVAGAVAAVWVAAAFWRNGAGSRWSRIHHTLIAASAVMLAWFFVTFHIAGTTLNY
jgi:hypothetical protein